MVERLFQSGIYEAFDSCVAEILEKCSRDTVCCCHLDVVVELNTISEYIVSLHIA